MAAFPDPADPMDIQHDAENQRFFVRVDGQEAEVDYEREGGVIAITHTGVPDAIGGRGIAGELNRAAFEYARREGLRVRPLCGYAAAWLRRHPEFEDVAA